MKSNLFKWSFSKKLKKKGLSNLKTFVNFKGEIKSEDAIKIALAPAEPGCSDKGLLNLLKNHANL